MPSKGMACADGSAGVAAPGSPASDGSWVGSEAAAGRRSVGQASSRSVTGTSESLGPPSSSAALPTASIRSVAALQLSYSSSVQSRVLRRTMIFAPSESKKEQSKRNPTLKVLSLFQGGALRDEPSARLGANGVHPSPLMGEG